MNDLDHAVFFFEKGGPMRMDPFNQSIPVKLPP